MILRCARCATDKPSSDFANGQQRKANGRYCRPCVSDVNREMKEKHGYNRTDEQRARYNATQREKYATNPKRRKKNADTWFRYRYGLTVAQIDDMIEQQGGVCAICKQAETFVDPRTREPRRLSVDHDHATGQPRGMVCVRCNYVLGRVEDSSKLLRAAADYVDAHNPEMFEDGV